MLSSVEHLWGNTNTFIICLSLPFLPTNIRSNFTTMEADVWRSPLQTRTTRYRNSSSLRFVHLHLWPHWQHSIISIARDPHELSLHASEIWPNEITLKYLILNYICSEKCFIHHSLPTKWHLNYTRIDFSVIFIYLVVYSIPICFKVIGNGSGIISPQT